MKISIIGTNGFLSSSIGEYCNQKDIILDMYGRSRPKKHSFNIYHKVDLLINEIPYDKIKNSDIIIYAAGAGIQSNLNESVNKVHNLNVLIPKKIINHLKKIDFSGVFISFGSYFEIGINNKSHSFTENELINSQNKLVNEYSKSKRIFSNFIFSNNFPFKFFHFILPTIYGENESVNRLIPYVINSAKNNKMLELTSGDQVREYIYIEDVIEIIVKSIYKKIPSGIYNVSGVESLSVKELVINLYKLLGKDITKINFGKSNRSDTEMKILKLNGTKLITSINYRPNIKISDIYERY